jgi:hypothetical protein
MEQITFEQLPSLVGKLCNKVDELRLLVETNQASSKPEEDEILTVEQCAVFLNLSKPTIYTLISKGELPVMKRSKR